MGLKRQIVVIIRSLSLGGSCLVRRGLCRIAVHYLLLPLIGLLVRLRITTLLIALRRLLLPVVGLLLLIGYIDIVPLLLPTIRLLLIILLLPVALRLGEITVLSLHRPGTPLVAVAVGVILHLHRTDHRDELPLVEVFADEVGGLPPGVHVQKVGDLLAVLSGIIPLHRKGEFGKRCAALGGSVIRLGSQPAH